MGFNTKVVGVTVDGRQELIGSMDISDKIYLKREKDNQYDNNAIAVYVIKDKNKHLENEYSERTGLSNKIGYLSREVSESLAPKMDNGQEYDVHITALTGDIVQNINRDISNYIKEERETTGREKHFDEDYSGWEDDSHEYVQDYNRSNDEGCDLLNDMFNGDVDCMEDYFEDMNE